MRPRLLTVLGTLIASLFLHGVALAAQPFYGVTPQWSLDESDFAQMERGAVGTLRMGIGWPALQRTKEEGRAIRTIYDDEFLNAAKYRVRILPFVTNTPAWVRPDEDLPPIQTERQRAAWERVLTLLVERYGRDGEFWQTPEFLATGARPAPVRMWQIWNEPSSPASWEPQPDPEEYADLLLMADAAIEAADPKARIMTAGNYFYPLNHAEQADVYMRSMLAVPGMGKAVNAVALHPYAKGVGAVEEQIKAVDKVLKGRAEKLYITESGWSSQDKNGAQFTSLRGQAEKLDDLFELARENRGRWNLGGIYWYSWEDLPPGEQTCLFCAQTGLLEYDGTPKPAWQIFQNYTAPSET